MSAIVALDITSFDPALTPEQRELAVRTVEEDGVLALPHVDFALTPAAQRFLSAEWSDGRAKNISFDGAAPKGARGSAEDRAALAAMVARFARDASQLVTTPFPRYAPHVKRARTSFRPQPAVGRAVARAARDPRAPHRPRARSGAMTARDTPPLFIPGEASCPH